MKSKYLVKDRDMLVITCKVKLDKNKIARKYTQFKVSINVIKTLVYSYV